MRTIDSTLVDIARDFLDAHHALRAVARRHRSGELAFAEVVELVGDDEESVLFRLKERCHRVFRGANGPEASVEPGVLFDLAVGSLFHEVMKFRENVYTKEVYGPRVRALVEAQVEDRSGLLDESQKIIRDSGLRLEEALFEAETLLVQMVGQFRELLRAHAANPYLIRFVVERRDLVSEVMDQPIEVLLAGTHESAGRGFALAADSYLRSGFFDRARAAAAEARRYGHPVEETRRVETYAEGMQAYLEGRYEATLGALDRWDQLGGASGERQLASQAAAALSRVGELAGEDARPDLGDRAATLARRLREHAGVGC